MDEKELLFTQILNCDRSSLYLNKKSHLDKNKSLFISSVLKRRILGEPIQYILGKTEFMGIEFKVTPGVFIPRTETEILVETAINLVVSRKSSVVSKKILDLGTGSGCIAIFLAKFLPNADITAVDISHDALEIAKYNARLNNVEERINFIQSDLFNTCDLRHTTYDLIISNPPYIPTVEIGNLELEIGYEPYIAINGGVDGLDFYRYIIRKSPYYLKENGFLIMEMGFNQKDAIKNIFQKSDNFKIIEIVKDYNNIDRVVVARLNLNTANKYL